MNDKFNKGWWWRFSEKLFLSTYIIVAPVVLSVFGWMVVEINDNRAYRLSDERVDRDDFRHLEKRIDDNSRNIEIIVDDMEELSESLKQFLAEVRKR